MSECTYVDGVVFRKNVSHKKMKIPEVGSAAVADVDSNNKV